MSEERLPIKADGLQTATEEDNHNYAIWWTSGSDSLLVWNQSEEDLQSEWMVALPEYIRDLVLNRSGRSGRGRLWIPDNIQFQEIEWKEGTLGERYARDAAGIVIHMKDAALMKRYPGIVTDLNLNII